MATFIIGVIKRVSFGDWQQFIYDPHRVFAGQEAVAHPTTRGAITTDVRESFFVITVRSTKGNFLNRLVDNQSLWFKMGKKNKLKKKEESKYTMSMTKAEISYFGVFFDNSQSIAGNVQNSFYWSTSRILLLKRKKNVGFKLLSFQWKWIFYPKHFECFFANRHTTRLVHFHASQILKKKNIKSNRINRTTWIRWRVSTNLDVKIASSSSDGGLVRLPLVRFGTLRDVVFAATETFAEASPQSLHPLMSSALLGLAFLSL